MMYRLVGILIFPHSPTFYKKLNVVTYPNKNIPFYKPRFLNYRAIALIFGAVRYLASTVSALPGDSRKSVEYQEIETLVDPSDIPAFAEYLESHK
jgi:hypothetical protein